MIDVYIHYTTQNHICFLKPYLFLQLHRRTLGEDGKGVGEALNETGQFGDGLITRGKHYLLFDTVKSSAKQHRLLAGQVFLQPLVAFQNSSESKNEETHIVSSIYSNSFSFTDTLKKKVGHFSYFYLVIQLYGLNFGVG